jgi:hypothetical protein
MTIAYMSNEYRNKDSMIMKQFDEKWKDEYEILSVKRV